MNFTQEDIDLYQELIVHRIRYTQRKVDGHEFKEQIEPNHTRARQLDVLYARLEHLEDALSRLQGDAQ